MEDHSIDSHSAQRVHINRICRGFLSTPLSIIAATKCEDDVVPDFYGHPGRIRVRVRRTAYVLNHGDGPEFI